MKYIIFITLILLYRCCHYTCNSCVGQTYLNCTQCNYGSLQILFDSAFNSTQLFPEHIYSGVCIQKKEIANAFGISIIIGVVTSIILTKNRELMVYLSSLQDLSFLSLIEIGYINPLNYMMNGLQYTLLFSVMSKNIKSQDRTLEFNYVNHLQDLLVSSDLVQNNKAMGIFLSIILFIGFLSVILVQIRRRFIKKQDRNKKIEKGLNLVIITSKYMFYYLIAEQILIIAVNIFYNTSYSGETIIIAFYAFLITYFFIYVYYKPLKFFDSQFLTYFNLLKKIIYPVIVVMNFSFLFTLPIIMLIFTLIELFYEWKIANLQNKTAILYKCTQFFIVILYIIYVLISNIANTYSASLAFSILLSISLICYSIFPWYQIGSKIKQLIKKKQQQNIATFNTTIEQLGKQNPNKILSQIEISNEKKPKIELQNNINLSYQQEMRQKQYTINQINLNEHSIQNSIQNPNQNNQLQIYNFDQDDFKIQRPLKKIQDDQATIKIQSQKDKMIAMMNLTQKNPKKRRMLKDRDKQRELKLAYGLKQ